MLPEQDMESEKVDLKWSSQYTVVAPSRNATTLSGDKILLPPSALEQLLAAATTIVDAPDTTHSYSSNFDPYNPHSFAAERHARAQLREQRQQLPHPLTFRLVNPDNGRIVYAGIREFSAEEGEVVLSPILWKALGLNKSDAEVEPAKITIHAKQLGKGKYVRLRPLEAGYDPEDWKSLLEQHLRVNFTTLTNNEILTIPGPRGGEEFRFLIDKFEPEGDGICVVDTDLEVDIEALNEEQARETLQRQLAKKQKAPGTKEGSSAGGNLGLDHNEKGQVLQGDYVDYELSQWDRSKSIVIELGDVEDEDELDLFLSPYSTRQRAKPRDDGHVFGDFSSRYPKRIRIEPTNVELEGAEALWISVHAYTSPNDQHNPASKSTPKQFSLHVSQYDSSGQSDGSEEMDTAEDGAPNPGEVRCKNCQQWVPERTMILHENFCLRNNILCPHCKEVFKKSSPEWQNHWHCPHDLFHGTTSQSKSKHDDIFHTLHSCPHCSYPAESLPYLAQHRASTCPGKLILCQFCHLVVPQEGDPSTPNAEALLSGLTPHELADGARTTNCHICDQITRLRDMAAHLKYHELERLSRQKPRICRNPNCFRTLDGVGRNGAIGVAARMGQGAGNDLGLCSICFGPLYVSMYDPDGKALRRRIERRYLTQLGQGCGRAWCKNNYCKSGRVNLGVAKPAEAGVSVKDAILMVKPFLEQWKDWDTPLHFCVDDATQKRRHVAEMIAAEGKYDLEWCCAALEAEGGDLDKARTWLSNYALQRSEAGAKQ